MYPHQQSQLPFSVKDRMLYEPYLLFCVIELDSSLSNNTEFQNLKYKMSMSRSSSLYPDWQVKMTDVHLFK